MSEASFYQYRSTVPQHAGRMLEIGHGGRIEGEQYGLLGNRRTDKLRFAKGFASVFGIQ